MKTQIKTMALGLALVVAAGSATAFEATELTFDEETGAIGQAEYDATTKEASVYVLEFFSLACGWCQANASYVNALRNHFGEEGNGVEIVSIGIDRQVNSYRRWFQRFDPNHPILQDVGGVLFDQYGVRGTPTAVVLDCNLEEVHRHSGFWNLDGLDEMKQVVDAVRTSAECLVEVPDEEPTDEPAEEEVEEDGE